jgi:hypothetical protein
MNPPKTPLAAFVLTLVLAWLNFVSTGRWASLPGALQGPRWPLYAAALLAASALLFLRRREVGAPVRIGTGAARAFLAGGLVLLAAALVSRLPPTTWNQLLLKDDWTELFQQAANGVHLLRRGSVVGWNWWMQGGYPTSTDIAQNLASVGLIPMTLFGDRIGYHLLHFCMFFALPLMVWRDLRDEDREAATLAAGFTAVFTAGYMVTLGNSGDTNSLTGVFCAALAMLGSRAARQGHRWGGPAMVIGLALCLYTHTAFFVYAGLFLTLEAIYFRDGRAFVRMVLAGIVAGVAALPVHWESLRYPAYVSFNNTVYDPSAPKDWGLALRTIYYNTEMLVFPHRWFNDYRSLCNVWLPVLAVAAFALRGSRAGFYAAASLLAQILLRFNTSEAGAIFDRIQHMLPVLAAPALAGAVLRWSGTRQLALAFSAVIACYVATSFVPIRHAPELRDFDPPLIDRLSAAGGHLVVVEIAPHRDMDADPVRRTPKTPFDVHFEGVLPTIRGQRFYSQMIDGWVWNIWRGQVVAAGTFRGRPIAETPVPEFVAELQRWGVRDLFVWTDASREYLAGSGRFAERWRGGLWSQFELTDADTRAVVVSGGDGDLRNLDFLGGDVVIRGGRAGETVIVRTNFYPAWRASLAGRDVPLFDSGGQLAFRAPMAGDFIVRLDYPRYHALSLIALFALLAGGLVLSRV